MSNRDISVAANNLKFWRKSMFTWIVIGIIVIAVAMMFTNR